MLYAQREALLLAPYAMHAADSAGRRTPEEDHPYRSPYQRDRDRITHSAAFRRLADKTQVFTGGLAAAFGAASGYHRSRLTHTLEVASIARTIARALRLNEDLVEALALAHDVGHPPFGHAGEALLDARLGDHGGFNHNRQAVRIFSRLERRYVDREGLNLTDEVLTGQRARGQKAPRAADGAGPPVAAAGDAEAPLLEVQVADAADSIAYDAHDADDALVVGLISREELAEVPLWRETVARVVRRHAGLGGDDLRRAAIHELIDRQVGDLIETTGRTLSEKGLAGVADVRRAGPVVTHSSSLAEERRELEAFLFRRVYRHPQVLAHRDEATAALAEAYERALARVETLPEPLPRIADEESPERAAADHVAAFTDRAVLEQQSVGAP